MIRNGRPSKTYASLLIRYLLIIRSIIALDDGRRVVPSSQNISKVTLVMNKTFLQRKINRVIRKITDLLWKGDQWLRQTRLRRLPQFRRTDISRDLTSDSRKPIPDCLLTISFGSRQLGNRDNRLDKFCQSFLAMTAKPRQIEIIIKLDVDDDLLFYELIKIRYKDKIHFRFYVSERGRGYADMHIWHDTAFHMRSPSSLALFILTEDAVFIHKHWDAALLAIIRQQKHNYFIGAPYPVEEAITVIGPNPAQPVPIYWLVGVEFPIIGMGLLECLSKAASHYPGWTCYGNLLLIDSFSGDILRGLWKKYQYNLVMQTPEFVKRTGVFSWTDSPQRSRDRNDTLLEFFKSENQNIRDAMVEVIYKELHNKSLGKA